MSLFLSAPKPLSAPSFSFGAPAETTANAIFSFQLPKTPISVESDAAKPSFSFGLPSVEKQENAFSDSVSANASSDATSAPGKTSPKPSFGFSLQVDAGKKSPETKPASAGFSFAVPSTGFSFGASAIPEPTSLKNASQDKVAGKEQTAAPAFSFSLPGVQGKTSDLFSGKALDTSTAVSSSPKASDAPKPFSFPQEAKQSESGPSTASFDFGAVKAPSSEPVSVSTKVPVVTPISFDLPSSASSAPAPALGTSAPSSSAKPLFDLPPATSSGFQFGASTSKPTENAPNPSTAAAAFQFGESASAPTTTQPVPSFAFGNAGASSTAPAPSSSFKFGESSQPPAAAATSSSFQFAASSAPSATPASTFQFDNSGAATTPSTVAPASSGFQFGSASSTSAPSIFSSGTSAAAPVFGFGSSAPASTTSNAPPASTFGDSSAMATNSTQFGSGFGQSAQSIPSAFGFGSAPPTTGFGQTPTSSSMPVFGQQTPSTAGFSFGSESKPSFPSEPYQPNSSFQFGQTPTTPVAAPSNQGGFSFGSATTSTPSFPGAINFDGPVPENLGGSFSHGMAPQGRPMVKAKRVARKR